MADRVITFATMCSGIGAPEMAFIPLGWHCVFQSEIDKFASAVLARHYPDVPNYGDMTRWRDWPEHDLDLLVAGTPCQSFSVAGLRGSLADKRGNLTLEFVRYANENRPRFILWENVPGVLSTKDNAFGKFLGLLAGQDDALVPGDAGWTKQGFVFGPERQIAWRILDAQYFGVPQRRRRVFVVAGDVTRRAGNWACARALFSEREGVRGDIAKGGTARADIAGTLGGGSGSRGWCDDLDRCGAYVTMALNTKCNRLDAESQTFTIENSTGYNVTKSKVRRLTPLEWERLQGFPDGYTAINYRGKTASDATRYRAIGNSMAVPVIEWIGKKLGIFLAAEEGEGKGACNG